MALFNNQYYNPMYPNSIGNYYQPQTGANSGGIIWVQGEAAAKSYLVAPNSTVQLWDSEQQVIYVKSADASGMPTMKVLDYTIRDAQKPVESVSTPKVDYVTREDLNAVYGQISDLRAEIDGLSIRRPTKKKEVTDDE